MQYNNNLIEINKNSFDVEIDLLYASKNNFTGKIIYKPNCKCYLHKDAARKLQLACNFSNQFGYRLKITDAFRPMEAQHTLWNHTPDANYVSDPNKKNPQIPHCRGGAIDLTLLDTTGKELNMGTKVDEFSHLSTINGMTQLNSEEIRNRCILTGIMVLAGWDYYEHEWWHYQLPNLFTNNTYPIIYNSDLEESMLI